MNMDSLKSKLLIQTLSKGQPPLYGLSRFTVGEIGKAIQELDEEYSDVFEHCGQGFAAFVVATFGLGKTHFLFQFRELFGNRGSGIASAYFELERNVTELSDMTSVVQTICKNIEFPKSDEEILEMMKRPSLVNEQKGIRKAVEIWLSKKEKEISGDSNDKESFINFVIGLKNKINESHIGQASSFSVAFVKMIDAIVYSQNQEINDMHDFFSGTLSNDKCKQYKLLPLKKTNSIDDLNELVRILKILGFTGLLIMFDESEFQLVSKPDKRTIAVLNQTRSLIDKIHRSEIPSVILLYTILKKEQIHGIYGALESRTKSEFSLTNPLGSIIDLERIRLTDDELLDELKNLGMKIAKIYQEGYNVEFSQQVLQEAIMNISKIGVKYRLDSLSSKRSFIIFIIKCLNYIKSNPDKVLSIEEIENLSTDDESQNEIDESEKNFFDD